MEQQEFFGDKEVRWYQVAATNQTIKHIEDGHKRVCIVLPTGAGKTITVAFMLGSSKLKQILNVHDRPLRVLFVAHNHRLLTQAERTFAEESGVEIITQSMMSAIPQDVIDQGFDCCVIDESHHEACVSFQLQLEHLGETENNRGIIIGLTATPDRHSGEIIKFDKLVNPISREQAVKEGYLAETHLHTFVDGSERSKAEIGIDILKAYAHEMKGTLIFARTKKEVTQVNNWLLENGYKSIALLDQSHRVVDEILDAFSNKEYQFIVSCNKLSEGVNVLNCKDILLLRSVSSYPLLNQIIGRASRPDCPCCVWEIVNPFAKDNLDTTCVVGEPKEHKLMHMVKGQWVEEIM